MCNVDQPRMALHPKINPNFNYYNNVNYQFSQSDKGINLSREQRDKDQEIRLLCCFNVNLFGSKCKRKKKIDFRHRVFFNLGPGRS